MGASMPISFSRGLHGGCHIHRCSPTWHRSAASGRSVVPANPQAMDQNPVLPFAEKEYVDMARAGDILGVSWQTVMRLAQSGMLRMVEWRSPSRRLVHYGSLVDFCDDLRRQYMIPDRRPTLSA